MRIESSPSLGGPWRRFRKDDKGLTRAYRDILQHYDQEMKLNRPEYGEHQTSLNDFHRAALEATGKASNGT